MKYHRQRPWKDDVSKNWKMFKEALCYFVTTAELKVIPLKLFYYQTIFETWHNQHSLYEH